MRKKLKELNVKMASLRVKGAQAMVTYAQQHLRGHINYYAVSGNLAAGEDYYFHLGCILYKWLNRRSQRKSLDWKRFNAIFVKGGLLPRVRLVHNLYNFPGFVPR
jgi:RNA-directed DNA polymerase